MIPQVHVYAEGPECRSALESSGQTAWRRRPGTWRPLPRHSRHGRCASIKFLELMIRLVAPPFRVLLQVLIDLGSIFRQVGALGKQTTLGKMRVQAFKPSGQGNMYFAQAYAQTFSADLTTAPLQRLDPEAMALEALDLGGPGGLIWP